MGTVRTIYRPETGLSRRTLLGAGAASLGLLAVRPAMASLPTNVQATRLLTLQNLHTGERIKSEYWANGGYLPESLSQIAHVLRDHRNDAVHPINTDLLDLLHRLHSKLDVNAPFQVISGYRSPESNAKLAAASHGVATHSLHMEGMAIDIRVPGVDLKNLHKAAMALGAGGVGYYAQSNFVHMDVGRVRYW